MPKPVSEKSALPQADPIVVSRRSRSGICARSSGFSVLGWLLMIPVVLIILLIVVIGFYEGRKAYWDSKVREMCEKNGGIKIFQIVELPENEYKTLLNNRNQIDLPHKNKARADQLYVYSTETEYVVRGSLEVRKYVTRVLRKTDGVALSEQVGFSRVGGDFPTGIGHPTYFSCPVINASENIFEKTFTNLR